MRWHDLPIALIMALSPLVPMSAATCPSAVTAAVQKAHVGADIASCKEERENGTTEFEVEVTAKDGTSLELDVSPDGTILLTEQSIAVSDIPTAVMKAFAAKYRAAKPTRAELQTDGDGKITYELAFADGTNKKEATFASDGAFVDEE